MNVLFRIQAVVPKDGRPPAVLMEMRAGGISQTLVLAPEEAIAMVAQGTAALEVIAAAPKIALPPAPGKLVVPGG